MNLGVISEQLPTYPNSIQGELRIILQTKDIFLVCYKHLEEYRRLVNEQNRLITKEFVQEQIQIGEDEIAELKLELQDAEARLSVRLKHNELLADHLSSLGFASLESGASVRHLALCRSPQMRKNMIAQRQNGSRYNESRPATHMIDNIALAISEIHQEVRSKVKPLLDYYRDLFYLQLHFSLVLGQVCNYCMPLVTENIGLIDRIFFWSERPEFDLVRRAGDISDRLKEIYTRAQTVLGVLAESVKFLQSKVELQKTLEQRFHERLDEQQKTKDKILRDVHSTKQNMDLLEEENDRLVGSLVKIDPTFVDSRHFYELAEGGNLAGLKRPGTSKDTTQNNASEKQESTNFETNNQSNLEFEQDNGVGYTSSKERSLKLSENSKSSPTKNITFDANNNKAISIAGDPPTEMLVKRSSDKKLKQNHDKGVKNATCGSSNGETKVNRKASAKRADTISKAKTNEEFITVTSESNTQGKERSTKPKRRSKSVNKLPSRSKSQQRETNHERKQRSPSADSRRSHQRAHSLEKHEKKERLRSKSSIGTDISRQEKMGTPRIRRRNKSSDKLTTPELTQSSTTKVNVSPKAVAPLSLKTKLLGRTRDLLDAVLNRENKSSSIDFISRTGELSGSSFTTEHINAGEGNNEGVTSVSSFASILIPDSPLGEPDLMLGAHVNNIRKTNKKNRRVLGSNNNKSRSNRRGKTLDFDAFRNSQLPKLSSDALLIETTTDVSSEFQAQNHDFMLGNKRSPHQMTKTRSNNLGDFLAGTDFNSYTSSSSPTSLPAVR